jgi:hypothetical protein
VGGNTRHPALRQLHDEAPSVTIELHRQQIDPTISLSSKMRQRTFEPSLAKRRNKTRFQRAVHLVTTHRLVILRMRQLGRRLFATSIVSNSGGDVD